MMTLKELIVELNEDALFLPEEFDSALMGYGVQKSTIAVYDTLKVISILKETQGFSEEDAWDHYYYNIEGGYVGDYMPVFFHER